MQKEFPMAQKRNGIGQNMSKKCGKNKKTMKRRQNKGLAKINSERKKY